MELDEGLLEEMFEKATSLDSQDQFASCMFCTLVRNNPNLIGKSSQMIVDKIKLNNVPQALKAVNLLEECMSKCGPEFQAEISKYRFLNKLIELVSANHLGKETPREVKDKIMDCFLLWTAQYPDKEKIKSAYETLRQQGAQHTSVTNTLPLPSVNSKRDTFLDYENESKLKKLLKSTNKEDLKQANLLIQYHVEQDSKKTERKLKQKSELNIIQEHIDLFNKVLDTCAAEISEDEDNLSLLKDLYDQCEKYKSLVSKMPEIMEDSEEELICDTIEVNENLLEAIKKYQILINKITDKNTNNLNSVSKKNQVDDLLGFIEKREDEETVSASATRASEGSLDELNEIFGKAAEPNITFDILKPIPATAVSIINKNQSDDKTKVVSTSKSVLATIDNLSEELFKENLKSTERRKKFETPSVKISLNELSKSTVTEQEKLNTFNVPLSFDFPPEKSVNHDQLNNQPEDEEILINKRAIEVELESKVTVNRSPEKNLDRVEQKSSHKKLKHLSEININLDEIQPSTEPPCVLMDEKKGLKVILNFAVDKPSENISVIVISTINQSYLSIDEYQFDASVRKPCKLRLLAPTGSSLPGIKPFRPPSDNLQQVMLLFNPTKMAAEITCIISYKLEDDPDLIKESLTASIPLYE